MRKYDEKFKKIKIFIAPDYSLCGDNPFWINLMNIGKARTVSLYLINVLNKIVIPNISFVDEMTKEACFTGIDRNSVIALNVKGFLKKKKQKELFKEHINEIIKRVNPSIVIIYNVSTKSNFFEEQINILENSGAKVIIPKNKLLNRNSMLNSKLKENTKVKPLPLLK